MEGVLGIALSLPVTLLAMFVVIGEEAVGAVEAVGAATGLTSGGDGKGNLGGVAGLNLALELVVIIII